MAHHQQERHRREESGNNHASWWTAQVAAVASFVEDEGKQMAFKYYSDHIFPRQIRPMAARPAKRSARWRWPIRLSTWKPSR